MVELHKNGNYLAIQFQIDLSNFTLHFAKSVVF